LLFAFSFLHAQTIIVDITGKGNFTSIQEAVNSLSDNAASPRIIHIKKGIYKEKIFIAKNNIVLEGDDKNTTILTQAIARDEWRCDHADDWGVATLNLRGSDITLQNLTIQNTYGFDNAASKEIPCAADTVTHKKQSEKMVIKWPYVPFRQPA